MGKKRVRRWDPPAEKPEEAAEPKQDEGKEQSPAKEKVDMPDQAEAERRKTDYEKLLDKVEVVHELTNTDGWNALYSALRAEIDEHAKKVLDADKPRDVMHHQEGVKVLRHVIDLVKRPVDDLNEFINSVPMFAPQFKTRAEWSPGLGKVVLKELRA